MVKASIVVQFGARTDAVITAELDADLNGGKTSFAPGDSVHFRVYADTQYTVHRSSGTVTNMGTADSTEKEVLTFALEDVARVSKPINTLVAMKWFGTGGGSVSKIGSNDVRIPTATGAHVGELTYTARYDKWRLNPPTIPAGEEYAIIIVVAGE